MQRPGANILISIEFLSSRWTGPSQRRSASGSGRLGQSAYARKFVEQSTCCDGDDGGRWEAKRRRRASKINQNQWKWKWCVVKRAFPPPPPPSSSHPPLLKLQIFEPFEWPAAHCAPHSPHCHRRSPPSLPPTTDSSGVLSLGTVSAVWLA